MTKVKTTKKLVAGIAIVCLLVMTFFWVRAAVLWYQIGQSVVDVQGQMASDMVKSLPDSQTKPTTRQPKPSGNAEYKPAEYQSQHRP